MNEVYINTSQNVTIDYILADIGKRILARILDYIFLGIYIFIAIYLITTISENGDRYSQMIDNYYNDWGMVVIFIIFTPVLCYSLWMPYFMQGQTLGKRIMKIKIVKVDGSECTFGTYFIRWIMNIIDSMFYNIVGIVTMAATVKRQRVADLSAKTVVISTQQTFKVDQTILSQVEDNYQPKFTQVLQLSDSDIQIISSSLQRAKIAKDYTMMTKLRSKIEEVTHEYKLEMADIEYIETVLKDYQFFSQQ